MTVSLVVCQRDREIQGEGDFQRARRCQRTGGSARQRESERQGDSERQGESSGTLLKVCRTAPPNDITFSSSPTAAALIRNAVAPLLTPLPLPQRIVGQKSRKSGWLDFVTGRAKQIRRKYKIQYIPCIK